MSFISFYVMKMFSESVTPSCLLVSPVLTFCMVLYDNNLNSCQVVFFEFNWSGISLCLLKEFHLLNKDFWFTTTDLGTNTCCYTTSLVMHSCHICVVQWMLTSCTLSCTVNFTETITALCHYVICCTTPAKCLVAMHLRHKNLLACGAGMLKSEMKQIKAK